MTKFDQINNILIQGIEYWNVFGLPALLVALIVLSCRKPRETPGLERLKTIRRLGRTHQALAFWSLTTVVAELWAYRTMGIFPSNPITGLFGSAIMMGFDTLIGFGLLRLSRVARWGAILWSLFRVVIAVIVGVWLWQYAPRLDWTEWPRDVLYWAFPPFELMILLAPGTSRWFRKPAPEETGATDVRFSWVSIIALVFLAVAVSAGLTDALDWTTRTIAETLLEP